MAGKLKNQNRTKKVSGKNTQKLPPYHVFMVLDEFFMLETCTMQFYQIDKLTYELLCLCATMSIDESKQKLYTIYPSCIDIIDSVCKEVKLLASEGLFEAPNNYTEKLNVSEFLDSYDFEKHWGGVELNLANCCNFACKYCYCSKYISEPNAVNLMKNDVAKKAIDMLLETSSSPEVNITFFGGEPLLNKKTIAFIMQYAPEAAKNKQKKINFIMTTNGSLVDDEIVDYIVDFNFGLMVSMDGDKELHNSLCPTKSGDDSFDLVMQGVRKIRSRRKTLSVRATLTHPVPQIEKMIEFFEGIGFNKIILGPALNIADFPSEYSFTKADFEELSRQDELLIPKIVDSVKNKEIPSYFKYHIGINAIALGKLGGRVIRCSAA